MKKTTKTPASPVVQPTEYGKRAIIESDRFYLYADLLQGLLDDNETYTLDEVQDILERHLKGKVK